MLVAEIGYVSPNSSRMDNSLKQQSAKSNLSEGFGNYKDKSSSNKYVNRFRQIYYSVKSGVSPNISEKKPKGLSLIG